jgi:hypothetical protein
MNSMTTFPRVSEAPGSGDVSLPKASLGEWVEYQEETCRAGRVRRLLVNHHTNRALTLDDHEAELCRHLISGTPTSHQRGRSALLSELEREGFLAHRPHGERATIAPRRGIRLSLATLDLRWNGADRLVQAAYRWGGRHLFRPLAVFTQVALAASGAAALAAILLSDRGLHLRVQPAQVPIILALTVLAVAVHELAHALVVVHHRRRIDAMGLRLLLGTPAFYVESVDALLLERRQRIIQAAAGPWAEWLVVSASALILWRSPDLVLAPLLRRFVILNAATIASNLLPFAGLDGSWLLADALHEPDLHQRSHQAVRRLVFNVLEGARPLEEEWALAGYSTLNSIVAAGLLATSMFFWYQLFAQIISGLAHHGPLGWVALTATIGVLARPVAATTASKSAAVIDATSQVVERVRFRLQWRWRIPATHNFAAAVPALGSLDDNQLSVIAGQLQRRRVLRHNTHTHHGGTYTLLHTGTATIQIQPDAPPQPITAGATIHPNQRLYSCSRGALLITLTSPPGC